MNRVVCPKCDSVAMVRSLTNPKYMRCGVCDLMVRNIEAPIQDGEELYNYDSHRIDVLTGGDHLGKYRNK